jgi:hypothetical protein
MGMLSSLRQRINRPWNRSYEGIHYPVCISLSVIKDEREYAGL